MGIVTIGPKPYKFIGFGGIHGPKPYKFIGFGGIHGPKPYRFIGFGFGRGNKKQTQTLFGLLLVGGGAGVRAPASSDHRSLTCLATLGKLRVQILTYKLL